MRGCEPAALSSKSPPLAPPDISCYAGASPKSKEETGACQGEVASTPQQMLEYAVEEEPCGHPLA